MAEAQIVKQMKAHGKDGKSVGHSELYEMVAPLIKVFRLDRKMFKDAVEFLLGGDGNEAYMERCQDRTRYSYLA